MVAQSASAAQLVLHVLVVGSHTKGAHVFVIAGGQAPLPSQRAGSVCTSFEQLWLRHVVSVPT
jgi:hypothetical protein